MGHTPTSLAAGFAITAGPGPGGPSRQAARPVIPLTAQPDNGGAGQMQRHRHVPARGGAGPDRGPETLQIAGTRPDGRAGPPREQTFNRVSARRAGSVTRHPQGAATASGDVAAGRRGRIADRTTVMLPGGLAAVSSLPLAGQRAAPPCRTARSAIAPDEPCIAGRTSGSGPCSKLRTSPRQRGRFGRQARLR